MEVWKEISGSKGLYFVSDQGRIKSIGRYRFNRGRKFYKEKILSLGHHPTGYLSVRLHSRIGNRSPLIHRIVAEAFIVNPENLPCINHKNGIKDDNRADNLEWVTYHQNINHAIRTGLMNNNGERCRTSVLTNENVTEIKMVLKSGGWGTITALAKKFNVTPSAISSIKHEKSWKSLTL